MIRDAARDIRVYELGRPDGGRLPAAEPGAHIDLHLPNGMVRQYSLIVPDAEPTSYTVGVKRDERGRGGSRYIHAHLQVSARLTISPPRNNFPLVDSAHHSVLLAGGIGITPIWSMVQRLAALRRSWSVHYACRSRRDAAFLAELQTFDGVQFHFDDESRGQPLDVGAVVAAAPADAHLYCCGPAPMLATFEAAAADWPREQVHLEYFARAKDGADSAFVVELARTGREFLIPSGTSILSVLRDAGISVTSSCEQGVCGACETRVISGIPDHRDMVLSDLEHAENKSVLICCARSKSNRLILDL